MDRTALNGIIHLIKIETLQNNIDNLSRTDAYKRYFLRNSEISWAYLASMVSRNAGWNMSDLWSKPFTALLNPEKRRHLFITYERANWLIFSDAYPQLLVYEWSKKYGTSFFHLLPLFGVSEWMRQQWEQFWIKKDKTLLLQALIINEQHLIQEPVIESPFFQHNVFNDLDYLLQERLHFSVVVLPTFDGDIFGRSVKNFLKVERRVKLGKELAWILFHSKERKRIFHYFCLGEFTGSRNDYRKWQTVHLPQTPMLKYIYPYVYHEDNRRADWSRKKRFSPDRLLREPWKPPRKYELTGWYERKQQQLMLAAALFRIVGKKNG
ncbi:Protein of unknown function [Evansella caseinilytica]|uniref:DUF2515 domain-containing protein n=1 Tax=Evansella caseinilytica TaxID=1503961 RepID=A0A1H3NJT4_9BACI|nr:DUF2515 family protein [Evansella caseinilytica]SDY88695.1 Protein of unknown function [Evansella caseinilytica]